MTEIPEHLLKRSRERRAALGSAANPGGNRPPPTPPRRRRRRHAQAAGGGPGRDRPGSSRPRRRHRPPHRPRSPTRRGRRLQAPQADPVLGDGHSQPAAAVGVHVRPRRHRPGRGGQPARSAIGAETYGSCATCHGGNGGGGVGYPFTDGEVLKTFPHIEDQLRFVYYGTAQYDAAGVDIYGDPDREGGPHLPGATGRDAGVGSGNGELTDAEILGVVCHERYTSAAPTRRPTSPRSSRSGARRTPRSSPTSRPATSRSDARGSASPTSSRSAPRRSPGSPAGAG